MRYTSTPFELLRHVHDEEVPIPSTDELQQRAQEEARRLKKNFPKSTDYLYGPDVAGRRLRDAKAILDNPKRTPDEEARATEAVKNVTALIRQSRAAFGEALRGLGFKVLEAQQKLEFTIGAADPMDFHGYIPFKDSNLGYKISKMIKIGRMDFGKNKEKFVRRTPVRSINFGKMDATLMPEKIDFLEREYGRLGITYAPYQEGLLTMRSREVVKMPANAKILLLNSIVYACTKVHSRGWGALDIKPENMLVDIHEEYYRARLGDLEGAMPYRRM